MSDPRSHLEQERRRFVQADGAFERLVRRRDRKRRNQRIEAGTVAIVVMVIVAAVFVHALRSASGPQPAVKPTLTPTIESEPTSWSPVREGEALPAHAGISTREGTSWHDAEDVSKDWIDITKVGYGNYSRQPDWYVTLAAAPAPAKRLDQGRLIAYGLVFDTTGDGIADYVYGIDNDAPIPGDLHVWVTDLATGETDDRVGGPYGFPIEFTNPLEHEQGAYGPYFSFTFLPNTAPAGFDNDTVRFYAWASETRDGKVVAWDLAPNNGWISQ